MREVIDLTGSGWMLRLDRKADWRSDPLHLPPVDTAKLPIHPPTDGWDHLENGFSVSVPGTVEEHTWDESGDYVGVSWWSRRFTVSPPPAGWRAVLRFASVRLRAEVFLNRVLVGYDAVGNTPFDCDVTDALRDGDNELAVRVTDPSGNFSWQDPEVHFWGEQPIPASHGFGGVTGPVELCFVPEVAIDDVFVEATPEVTSVRVTVTIANESDGRRDVPLRVEIRDGDEVLSREERQVGVPAGGGEEVVPVSVPDATPWSPGTPKLYECRVTLGEDAVAVPFGFRWFDIDDDGERALLRLNGRRIVLRSAISWGFWPGNGMIPTPELAEREVRIARDLGLNMLNFHRCIGRPEVFRAADELGLLIFEEPGGYECRGGDELSFALAREKLLRMVRRDRNHPSLVIYNLINEAEDPPTDRHRRDLADVHALDPTRVATYTSGWAGDGDDPIKLHVRPLDATLRTFGWFDHHHAPGPGVYCDGFYRSPTDSMLHSDNRREIVFWGEEGAIAAPPRLAKIVAELGESPGWDGTDYRRWHRALDEFLTDKGLREAFPTVDLVTESLGNVAYHYHARIIENVRIGDAGDGYVVNGWECEKLENHSGIVDCFRHPKGDPEILRRANEPSRLVVKARRKVGRAPATVSVDVHLVNEVGADGSGTLEVSSDSGDATSDSIWTGEVAIHGGDRFGELLVEGLQVPLATAGRHRITAKLVLGDGDELHDDDEVFLTASNRVPRSVAIVGGCDDSRSRLGAELGCELEALESASSPGVILTIGPPKDLYADVGDAMRDVNVEFHKGVELADLVATESRERVELEAGEPVPGVGSSGFSVRWHGTLSAAEDGEHRLRTETTDGARLWIGDRLVVDHWHLHRPREDTAAAISLFHGKRYDVRAELLERRGGGRFRLRWSTPTGRARGLAQARELLDRVRDGATLLVMSHAHDWADLFAELGAVSYRGRLVHGQFWIGGGFFAREHAVFEGLPVNAALGWEYQSLVHYDRERFGLRLSDEEVVAACVTDHQHEVATAVGVVEHGAGKILFSTLDVIPTILEEPGDGPAAVARALVHNAIAWA